MPVGGRNGGGQVKTTQVTAHGETVTAYMPTTEDVTGLRPGMKAINVWGRFEEVTDITARSTDIHGNEFVCYYTKDGSGWISASMKAGADHAADTAAGQCRL